MSWLKRALWLTVILLTLLVLILVTSILADAVIGRDRVAALANTTAPNPAGPDVRMFVARPPGEGPFPVVLMLHEFWGLKQEIVEKAQALAAEGYLVVAPDMYRGETTGWLPRAIYLALAIREQQVLRDLDATYQWAIGQPEADPGRIVVMGFCYGGGKALAYSLRNPDLAGTGIFYGTLHDDPALLARLPGPVLGIFGSEDRAPSPEMVGRFADALRSAGVPAEITVYDGVGHAFVTDMDAVRRGGPAGEAWAQFLDWLAATVQK